METPHDTAVSATKHTETNKKPRSSVSPHQARYNHSSKGPGKEKSTKTPPKAELRHDNSQIQFAAIESSPIEMYDLDLQRLTERQKEVKERQSRDVAVLFPQMNSSPIHKTDRMAVTLPRLSLSQVKPSVVSHDYEDESSPIFPSAEMLSKENLGSSPTPSAGRTPSDQTGIDIPLSPSGTPSIFNTPSFLKDSSQQDEIMGSSILPKARQESETYANELQTPQGPTLEVSKDVQSNIHSEGMMQGLCPSDQAVANGFLKDLEPLVSNANPDKPNNAILSNTGVFVDAPSEVNTDIISSNQTAASVEIGDDSMNEQRRTTRTQASNTQPSSSIDNMGKSVATEEIFMSTEDNDASQVTDSMIQFLDNPSDDDDRKIQEQLALELEHASSQTNSFATEAPPPTASTRKRKAGSSKEPSPPKKSRRRRSSSNVQVLIDASQPSSVEDDAVVVDVHPATGIIGTRSATVTEEKNETSSSTKLSKVDVPRTLRSTKATRVEANRISAGAAGSSRRRSTRLAQSSSFNEVSGNAAPRRGGKAPLGDQANVTKPTTDAIKQEIIQDDDNGSSSRPTDISSAAFEADDLSPPAETGTETVATAGEILAGFHAQLERLKQAELGPEEERAIVGAAFEIVREAHEAGRRSHRRSVS